MSYYTSGGGNKRTYKPQSLPSTPGKIKPSGAGKGSIDLTDPVGSIGATAQSLGEYAGGAVGGVAGAVGGVGFGDGRNIGAIADVPGNILGTIGGIGLPNASDGPGATVGDIPGKMLDIVTTPGRAVERTIAGQRVEGGPLKDFNPLSVLPGGGILTALDKERAKLEGKDNRAVPADLQARLDAGESVDVIADELVARGAGFSNDPLTNLAGQIVLDPLNLIAPGASKVAQGVKGAGLAVQVPEQFARMGIPARAAGLAYATAARNMNRGAAAFVDRTLGPVTSGALQALGTKPYRALSSGLSRLDRSYGMKFDDAVAVANANLHNAVIGDDIANDLAARLARTDDIEGQLGARLTAKRTYAPDELERRGQEMLERVAPAFLTETPEELAEFAAKALSVATDVSIEDARRLVGTTADVATARTAHWARYGRAIDDFGEAREAARGGKTTLDLDRLTLIADDTLTVERAQAIADALPGSVYDEAMRFSVVANHFLGKHPSDGQILEFIGKLAKEGALPTAVRTPKSGKNALPGPLGDWRQKYADNGYELGFAPKDGLKVIKDADDNVLWSKPFIGVTTRRDPVTVRNGLGRAMDDLFRGVNQTTIVQQSRDRMVRFAVKADLPVSPNQIRSIHKAIVDEAADRGLTPRALVGERTGGEPLYNAIFRRFLSDEEYAEVVSKYDPTYLVMRAFEGNLRTIGLTQKVTGKAKSAVPIIAKIAEALYPKARFTYKPTFQAQEMIESPVLNALRGIQPRAIDPDLAGAYRALAEQPEFKYLTEASFLNIAGDRMVTKFMGANTPVGRAMGRFTNIQSRKEAARVTQTLAEHGEEFRTAVQQISPKAWHAMEEAYGTTDPRVIADRFLAERMRLASGDIDEAMAAVDEAVAPAGAPKPFFERSPEERADIVQRLRDEGYVFHGSAVDPRTGGTVNAGDGFYTTEAFDYAELYGRGTVRNAEDAAASGNVYATKLPDKLDDLGDPAFQGRIRSAVADDLVKQTADPDFPPGPLSRAAKRVEQAQDARQMASALTDYAIERSRLHGGGIDSSWMNELYRSLGAKAIRYPDEYMASVGGAADKTAPTILFVDKPPLQSIDEVVASRASGAAAPKPAWAETPEGEMVWQAFKDSFRERSIAAFKTHFFNPQRGWLERTLNHPYLGLYPLSYMWGKVLPEFARFLVARPFGQRAPLTGLAGLERVQQAYLGALADDPDFKKHIDENADSIYFANLLFPGNPVNLAVNAPAWTRHIVEDAEAGRDINLNTVGREIADTAAYATGPVYDVQQATKVGSDLIDVGQDIFAALERAAREMDGQLAAAR